jgi:uncharacterized protein YndB with AHSA1/START domain
MSDTTGTALLIEPGRRQIVVTHNFDAPRDLVFAAYTDPEQIPLWWGPRVLTTVVDRMEVRPGGSWRFVQRDADGNVFAFHGVYHEITPPERLVYTFEYEGEGAPHHVLLETVTFEDVDGRTRVNDTVLYQSVEDRDGMVKAGMEYGVRESRERLNELLNVKQGV